MGDWPCWLSWLPAFACCFSFLPVASLTTAAGSDAEGRGIPIDVYLDKKRCHWIATEAIYGILLHPVIACQEISLFLIAFSNQVLTIKFSLGLLMCLATIWLNSLRKCGIHCLSISTQYYIISSTQILASYMYFLLVVLTFVHLLDWSQMTFSSICVCWLMSSMW